MSGCIAQWVRPYRTDWPAYDRWKQAINQFRLGRIGWDELQERVRTAEAELKAHYG